MDPTWRLSIHGRFWVIPSPHLNFEVNARFTKLGKLCSLVGGKMAQSTGERILVAGQLLLIKMVGHIQLLSPIPTKFTLLRTAILPGRKLHRNVQVYQFISGPT